MKTGSTNQEKFVLGPDAEDITERLRAWSDGEDPRGEQWVPLVYEQLREMAGRYLRGERPSTLQPTAVVHEVYFRLLRQEQAHWQDRSHFFGIAAQMMRRVIIDHARRYRYLKRGGGRQLIPLEEGIELSSERAADLIDLDDALTSLATVDPKKAMLVELRFFAGLSIEQTAEVLHLSRATVVREWRMAKAWLFRHLAEPCLES